VADNDPDTRPKRKLPVVPYREPEPWIPSGGFGEFRPPEQQQQDAELAAQHDAEEAALREEGEVDS
jgi:hypothetical protein